jgi:hypothetical protein
MKLWRKVRKGDGSRLHVILYSHSVIILFITSVSILPTSPDSDRDSHFAKDAVNQ